MMLVGIATAAMIVLRRFPRKKKTMTAARRAPSTRCSLTASTLVLMTPDSSRTSWIWKPAGSSFFRSSTRSLAALATFTVLAPDCLRSARSTVGSPSSSAADAASSTPSTTLPTSRTRMECPPSCRTTRSPICAGSVTRPWTRTVSSPGPVSTRPPGVVRFCAAMARWTSMTVTAAARRRTGSTSTFTWRLRPPMSCTCPTPSTDSSVRRMRLSASSVTSRIDLPSAFTAK